MHLFLCACGLNKKKKDPVSLHASLVFFRRSFPFAFASRGRSPGLLGSLSGVMLWAPGGDGEEVGGTVGGLSPS